MLRSSFGAAPLTILGVPVTTLGIDRAVDIIGGWIAAKERRFVCACDVHSLVVAQDDAYHMRALRSADMVVPDGMPLVWVGKLRGHTDMQRVCGADLLRALCMGSLENGWRHYFYGGAPGVGEQLANQLTSQYPGLHVVGALSPPFRALTSQEQRETAAQILETHPDIIWIGLGCPKQEKWMCENSFLFHGAVLIGIGAAFDFESGQVKRAPVWMQSRGLEWLYRLQAEPRRLWRRYFFSIPRFLVGILIEMSSLDHWASRNTPKKT